MFISLLITEVFSCNSHTCGFKIACDDLYNVTLSKKIEIDDNILFNLNQFLKNSYYFDSFFMSAYKDKLIDFVDNYKKDQKFLETDDYYNIITYKNRQYFVFEDIILPASTFVIICGNLKKHCEILKRKENVIYRILNVITNKKIKNPYIRKYTCNRNFLKSAGFLILESIILQLERIIFSKKLQEEDIERSIMVQDGIYKALEFDYPCEVENSYILQLFDFPSNEIFFSYIYKKREKRIDMNLLYCFVLSHLFSACYLRSF